MRKVTYILLLIVVTLSLLGSSQASLFGLELKNYPIDSELNSLLSLQSPKQVGNIIVLPEESFDQKEASKMIERIDSLPQSMLQKVSDHEIKLKLFEGKLTDNPTVSHLKGLIPRGYKSDTKWDDVPGIGGSKLVLVKIGHSEKGSGHGSVNLELHELAHSIDRHVYNQIRNNKEFLEIWELEKRAMFPGKDYFLLFPEEYFAETFAMYYVNENTREQLRMNAPFTYEFIKNLK